MQAFPTTKRPTNRPTKRPSMKPTTKAPTTKAPTTMAPTTKGPTTKAPTTKAPTTMAPTTTGPTKGPVTEAPTTMSPTTKGPVTESPAEALVPSPGNPPEGYPASGFLQNRDFGKINKNEYNIDLSLQVLDTSTIDAFVKARERWMTVITGDIEDVNVTEALLNVTGMTGVVPETHVMIDACGNPLPELIDDVHFCALEATIDGAGWMDVQWPNAKYYYNIMAIVYPEWLRDDGKVISGNIIFDTCDATNMMNLGLWDDFILKAMGTVLGTMPLAINTNTALVNGTNYVGG